VPVGLDGGTAEFTNLGQVGGVKTVTLTQTELPVHAHGITDVQHSHGQTPHGHPFSQAQHNHPLSGGVHAHSIAGDYGFRIPFTSGGTSDFVVNNADPNRSVGVTYSDINVEDILNPHSTPAGGVSALAIAQSYSGVTSIDGANANIQSAFSNINGTNNAGSGGPHQNLQPYITVNYIVKI
jgi:microcystin-dependent protein